MKKILLSLALITSILFTVQAGYIIRGVNVPADSPYLKNFTLTFNTSDEPVSAGSMIDPFSGHNSIVIINANNNLAAIFPILYGGEDLYIEVRDFHKVPYQNTYVLCGSRGEGVNARAFVATINSTLSAMQYNEYPEADIFYSIWADIPVSSFMLDYFVCGKKGQHGVIASIHRVFNLQLTNFLITRNEQEWEYHKIIALYSFPIQHAPLFVASGRNPDCTQIGFTVIEPLLNVFGSYMWEQMTDPLSHCVVSSDALEYNSIILASSYQNTVTLNPIRYPVTTPSISAYRYSLPDRYRYSIQDIGTIKLTENTFRISVAGFKRGLTAQTIAWHGHVEGLSITIPMRNNDYHRPFTGDYEHYKIRHDQFGTEYTGGCFQSVTEMSALFGTPLTPADDCDNHYPSDYPRIDQLIWRLFDLERNDIYVHLPDDIYPTSFMLPVDEDCGDFKGGVSAPELVLPIEDESDIITFYDRITIKDTPTNTNYQIYTITGQLIQTGTTTPDISTANLSKGIYILRLENGKAFKFVK